MSPLYSSIPAAIRRSVLLLAMASFASITLQRLCDAMLPELSREFQATLAHAGQVVSMFALAYGLSQLGFGPLGDRLGKYRVLTTGALGCCVTCLAALLAASLDWLVLARVLMGVAAAAIIPMALAWVGDAVPYEQRQLALARVGLGTTLGAATGQLLGGVFTDGPGWRWAFGFMALLFGVVAVLLLDDMRRQRVAAPAATDVAAPGAGFVAQSLLILTGRWSRVVLLVALIEGALAFGVMSIWASHLHLALGLSLSAAGGIAALFGLGGMLFMVLARFLVPLLGERGLVRTGVVLLGASALVIAFSPHWAPTLPASVASGFGFFMFHNTMQLNATQMAPAVRGTAVSLFACALFLGQSIGVLLATSLTGRIGSAAVIGLGGVGLTVLGLVFAQALRGREALMSRHLAT